MLVQKRPCQLTEGYAILHKIVSLDYKIYPFNNFDSFKYLFF